MNVTDEAAVRSNVDAIVKEFNNRLDVFVANSGIGWVEGSSMAGSLDHYKKVMQTNLDGVFYCARAAGVYFRKQKKDGLENFRGGSFIATASMSGHIVNVPQLQTAYNASKAGVIHMCKSLAVEWVAFGRVNTVSPGYFSTDITGEVPDDIRQAWIGKIPMG